MEGKIFFKNFSRKPPRFQKKCPWYSEGIKNFLLDRGLLHKTVLGIVREQKYFSLRPRTATPILSGISEGIFVQAVVFLQNVSLW